MTAQERVTPTAAIARVAIPRAGYCGACVVDVEICPADGLCPYCAGPLNPPRTRDDKAAARAEAAALAKRPLSEEGRQALGMGVVGAVIGSVFLLVGSTDLGRIHAVALVVIVASVLRIFSAYGMRE